MCIAHGCDAGMCMCAGEARPRRGAVTLGNVTRTELQFVTWGQKTREDFSRSTPLINTLIASFTVPAIVIPSSFEIRRVFVSACHPQDCSRATVRDCFSPRDTCKIIKIIAKREIDLYNVQKRDINSLFSYPAS